MSHRNQRIVAAVVLVVLAAALIVFVRWNQQEEERLKAETTYVPKPEKITPEILLLREYLRIDTTAGKELAGARWLVAQFAKRGIRPELIESGPGRGNVYVRIRGRQPGEGLMLLHHIDVAPVDPAEWKHPPFAGDIQYNMLYARGALDMKSIGICHLLAFVEIAKSGRPPEHDLIFLATSDEEQGSVLGIQWLLANRPDLFEGVRYVLNEGGITEMQAEQVAYFGIEIGTKQRLELRLHGSEEQLLAARRALEPIFGAHQPERVLPEIRTFMRDIAPTRIQFGRMLADIDQTIANGEFWELPKGYREHTQNNLWAEAPQGGTMTVRAALLRDEDPDRQVRRVEQTVAGTGVRLEVVAKDGQLPFSPADTPLFRIIASEAEREYRTRAGTMVLHGATNDSRFLRRQGLICYGVWPYPVDVFQSEAIHRNDERIRLDWFMQGIGVTKRIVTRYAFRE
ncbi:MAG TPA: M20/M25/M40 family metallo-hydrolase [Thermoanaerobaculia bacterium]|jgi:acetylornithine deacetylase/succinyl-diaminopimelate desuccinylase-like protein